MAARAAARAPRAEPWPPAEVLQDAADNPWRYSPEPPGEAACCETWRLDCHISDDPPIDRYMWFFTCDFGPGDAHTCDHEHHGHGIWIAP